jgi:3-hydroxyisobutyrate dehydrogenase-like beta-hydroxyacid dehydrogenase
MKTGFIGLGVMGYPMAGHLAAAGHEAGVFNRTAARAEAWVEEYGGLSYVDPASLAEGCDVVCVCVGRDEDVEAVVLGEKGALSTMQPGAILVDHTTTSASLARKLSLACAEKGVGFLDAPVSGGQAGAEQGVLSIMAGGSEEHFDRARPALEAYGRTLALIGEAGSGQLCKMVNQICIGGLLEGLAEALLFGKSAGLDMEKVMAVISGGAAQSWQMENRHKTMLKGSYDFGFAVDLMRKDLGIVFDEASRLGLELPVTELVDGYYSEVQAMGGGRWDTSSLMARLEKIREG